jgi:hypothetical protein
LTNKVFYQRTLHPRNGTGKKNVKSKQCKIRGLQYHFIKCWKTCIPTLKSWHFEATEDIMTKSKSQGLHIRRIKHWNASGSGSPTSLIPALWNIGILVHKQATDYYAHDCRIQSHAESVKKIFGAFLDLPAQPIQP